MKLVQGDTYKHKISDFVGIYNHSDELDHNHFFKIITYPKDWGKEHIKDGMVSLPTWEVQGRLEECSYHVSTETKEQYLQELHHEAYNCEDQLDGCFNPDDHRVIEDEEITTAYNEALEKLRTLCSILEKKGY